MSDTITAVADDDGENSEAFQAAVDREVIRRLKLRHDAGLPTPADPSTLNGGVTSFTVTETADDVGYIAKVTRDTSAQLAALHDAIAELPPTIREDVIAANEALMSDSEPVEPEPLPESLDGTTADPDAEDHLAAFEAQRAARAERMVGLGLAPAIAGPPPGLGMMPVGFRPWKRSVPAIIGTDYGTRDTDLPIPPGTIGETQEGRVLFVNDAGGWTDGQLTYGTPLTVPIKVVRWGRPGEVYDDEAPMMSAAAAIHRTAVEHGWWPGDEDAPGDGPAAWVRPAHREGGPGKPERPKLERNIGEALMLIVSEVAEAMEDYRVSEGTIADLAAWHTSWDESAQAYKPDGFSVEMIDIVIRCFDLLYALGVDIDHILHVKSEFNGKRPFKHGNKLA